MKKLSLLLLSLCVSVLSFGALSSTLGLGGNSAASICANQDVLIYTVSNTWGTTTYNVTNFTFSTSGTYSASDITNFKVWSNTTNTMTGATLKGTITTSLGTGVHSVACAFTGVVSATRFFFVTVNASQNATPGVTVSVDAMTNASGSPFTLNLGGVAFSGSATVGGAQTITTAGIISGTLTGCPGNSYTLSSTNPGGTWSSVTATKATINSSTGQVFEPSNATAGTSVISYTASGCTSTATFSANANPAALAGTQIVCETFTTSFTEATAGGTWSVANPTLATLNTASTSPVTITGLVAGFTTITYTMPAAVGSCIATRALTVNTQPAAIGGTLSSCTGITTTLTNSVAGGSWVSATVARGTIGSSSGDFHALTAGTDLISYNIVGNGGTCRSTATFTVLTTPAALAGTQFVCENATVNFTEATAGGTWSVVDPTKATLNTASTSPVTITALAAGATTISYTIGTCAVGRTLTVNTQPAAIGGTAEACIGTTTTLTNAVPGGAWTSVTVARATIGSSSGDVHALTAGTTVISYTITGSGGNCASTKTFTVDANPAALAGTQFVCEGSTVNFTEATAGGTWSVTSPTIATLNPASTSPVTISGLVAGSNTVTYTLGTGCFATRTLTVNTQPAAITGGLSGCVGASTTLSNATNGGTWTSVTVATATIGSSSGQVFCVAAGTSVISYTITGSGGNCASTKTFTVVANPAAMAGTQTVCTGLTVNFTDATAGGTWSVDDPSLATLNPASTSPVTITGLSAGFATVTYTLATSCFVTRTLTVNTQPAAITGSLSSCANITTTLSDATPGGAWTSVTVARATIGSSSGDVHALTTGTTVISYTLTGVGANCASTKTFSVLGAPAAIAGTQTVCAGSTVNFTNTTASGTWSVVNAAVATVSPTLGSPNVITGLTAGSTTISYSTGCGSAVGRSITVNTAPAAIGGTAVACVGTITTLTNSVGGGTWSSITGAVATIGSSSGAVSPVSAGTSLISYTIGSCASTKTFTVNSNPSAITGTQTVCEGSVTTFDDATGGGTWSVAAPTTATIDASTPVNITGLVAGNTTVSYTLSGTGCFATRGLTVNTTPTAITGTLSVCEGSSVTLGNSVPSGTWSKTDGTGSATISSGGVVTGVTAGTVEVTYTLGSCFSTSEVTVNTTPAAISGLHLVCGGTPITLTDATIGGTWGSSDPGFADVDASTGVVTEVAPGTVNITYTLGSCLATFVVTANEAPAAPAAITGTTTFCTGTTSTLGDVTPGGAWSSVSMTVATVDAGGVVTGVSGGSSIISYTATNACASTATTTNVTVVDFPSASITSAISPCTGHSTTITFTGTADAEITYTLDGGSSILATLTGGTFSVGSGVVTSSHSYVLVDVHNATCTTNVNQTANISALVMTWVGGDFGHANEWNRAANWSCNTIPSATDDVTIPTSPTGGAGFPTVETSGSAATKNLTIQNGASVALSTSSMLSVNGDLSNNGTVSGSGVLSMSGSSAQAITGLGSVDKFDLNNSNGATVGTNSRMIINSVLSVSSGTLATSDSVVLNSTDTNTAARIAQIPFSGSAITGNVQVRQYIPGGYRRYRFWSHPFDATISLGQVEKCIDVTGVGGAANGFTTTGANSPSAFRYDPLTGNSSLSGDPGWKAYTNISPSAADSNKLKRYQGIRVFMRGQPGQGLGFISEIPLPVTITQTGVPNQGEQIVTLKKGSSANQDYNMIGNPYASPTNIGAVITAAKIAGQVTGPAFYVWNTFLGASGLFQAITINTVTPTDYFMQANECFQVRADHNNATLTFEESHKGTTRTLNLMKAAPDGVTLNIYDANYHPWDMLHVKFNGDASKAEDVELDARKLMSDDFGFYSMSSDDQKLCIDTRPYETDRVVPLGIHSAYAQEFIIKAEGVVLPENGTLYLHDKLLKQYVLLNQGTEYRFNITSDEQTQGNNRFELSMKPAETVANVKGLQVSMTPNPATDEVKIKFTSGKKDNASVRVLDMSGVSVYQQDLGMQQNGSMSVSLSNFASGIYIVEVTLGNEKSVQRLVKE